MAKFRKKPVVIEAFQWTGNERPSDWPEWATKVRLLDGADLVVDTLEGRMKADLGDWIICGVKGEQYPCKPDIFFATYDPAGATDPQQDEIKRLRAELETWKRSAMTLPTD